MLASFLLGSCGGGGAGSPGPVGGPPQILPNNGTLYAGVEYTFTVGGGRPPYFLSSSEPSVLQVPFSVTGNTFTVIPANTAVVDTGLPPGSLPVRTVTLTMRDSIGSTASTGEGIQVAQNFMFGYPLFVNSLSNCAAGAAGATADACAGGESALSMIAAINGNLQGNREYRWEVVRGPFTFVNVGPNGQVPGSGTLGPGGNTWTTRSDHSGLVQAIIRVNNNVGTQIGVIRIVDTATGASIQQVFTIAGVPLAGALVAIPAEFTLTGRDTATCGTGSGDFQLFDGTPPYTAFSSFPGQLLVDSGETNRDVSTTQPGHFTFSATNPNFCLDEANIIVRDANNRQVVVKVTTEKGSAAPPPAPIVAVPGSVTLNCGGSGSVILLGGGGTFTISSPDPRITTSGTTRVLTITRVGVDPAGTPVSPTPGVPNPVNFTVNVTDGTNLMGVGVTAPSNCPP